jgi:acyl-CoA thioester hydrolase
MIWENEVTILESHLDTFGHINNAVYLQLFEQARWDIISARGYGLRDVQKSQIGPTILEINLQFRREIRLREKIKIVTSTVSHEKKITKLRQVMVNEKGEEACVADFTIALFDLKARKLIEPTPEWRHALALAD